MLSQLLLSSKERKQQIHKSFHSLQIVHILKKQKILRSTQIIDTGWMRDVANNDKKLPWDDVSSLKD